jgi:hypothetical protein
VYEKTIRDTFNDETHVSVENGDRVHLRVGAPDDMLYTPKQARQLARALKRAANVAEGKPAKAKKPAVIVDHEDDTWHLTANGKYSLSLTNERAVCTRAMIRRDYGIREER